LAALVLIAGRKLTKNCPHRFFARRGRKEYPRKSNLIFSYVPRRSSSLPIVQAFTHRFGIGLSVAPPFGLECLISLADCMAY